LGDDETAAEDALWLVEYTPARAKGLKRGVVREKICGG
jgi:hypothetical protein